MGASDDLLSAALSESGLDDLFSGFGAEEDDIHQEGVASSSSPVPSAQSSSSGSAEGTTPRISETDHERRVTGAKQPAEETGGGCGLASNLGHTSPRIQLLQHRTSPSVSALTGAATRTSTGPSASFHTFGKNVPPRAAGNLRSDSLSTTANKKGVKFLVVVNGKHPANRRLIPASGVTATPSGEKRSNVAPIVRGVPSVSPVYRSSPGVVHSPRIRGVSPRVPPSRIQVPNREEAKPLLVRRGIVPSRNRYAGANQGTVTGFVKGPPSEHDYIPSVVSGSARKPQTSYAIRPLNSSLLPTSRSSPAPSRPLHLLTSHKNLSLSPLLSSTNDRRRNHPSSSPSVPPVTPSLAGDCAGRRLSPFATPQGLSAKKIEPPVKKFSPLRTSGSMPEISTPRPIPPPKTKFPLTLPLSGRQEAQTKGSPALPAHTKGRGGGQTPQRIPHSRSIASFMPEKTPRLAGGGPSGPPPLTPQGGGMRGEVVDQEEDDEENLIHAETYADYMPSKLRSGLPHPDIVVETSSLSSVEPPDVRYHVSIPEETIDRGHLSALQLEAIIYACQMHENRLPSTERCGYLVGDGAGVGKGRTIAGIIFENYLLGRKRALWFSVSSDLKYDAERDLEDIGAGKVKVSALNKLKYSRISGKENGSIKKGVVFATYSSLIGESHSAKVKYRSRLKQLLHWCGKNFDGVIVFDECHRAKNLMPTGSSKPTKTGQAVLELQKALPNARVVYASATGATEPRNMAYMTRLGLWGVGRPFREFSDFINAVERRGVGAMELVAMDMKQRGIYLARQLSFAGVSFRVDEVPLSKEFIRVYDESVKLWLEARREFELGANLVDADRGQRKCMWGQFWAAHQRFFKYLCIASKVRAVVKLSREALKNGKCVVIGLQSTGEARTLEQLEESGGELSDFVSTAKAVFESLVDRHFPSDSGKDGASFTSKLFDIDSLFDFDQDNSSRKRKKREGSSKRRRVESEAGSEEEEGSGSEEEEGSGGSSDSSESSSEEEEEKGEDWLHTLFQEAGTSSEEESDDSPQRGEGKQRQSQDVPMEEEEFNPFSADFDEQDPWASKQQVVEEDREGSKSPEKKVGKEKRKKLKKKQKRKERKDRERLERKKAERNRAHPAYTPDHFLAPSAKSQEPASTRGSMASELNLNRAMMMKAELLASIERLSDQLPPNTLDQLINELGGPDQVAEMTGRKGRVVSKEDGDVQYELRNENDVPLELLNMAEKERFMNGEKKIAIISEAASSGISLQSDRRWPNQSRRVHITLELPWSADKAIQQFGRTHRSNQVSAPEYVFLISELAGEKRFASIVAKRLESLGALTHGDRRATETRDLSQFNLDTKYGRMALENALRSIIRGAKGRVTPPQDYGPGDFFQEMRRYLDGVGILTKEKEGYSMEKDAGSLSKFLNRILGLPVHAQNALFQYFLSILAEMVSQARKDGRYDMGILDLGTGGDQVEKKEVRVFLGRMDAGSYRTDLVQIQVERGMPWPDAFHIYTEARAEEDGFYFCNSLGRGTVILVAGMGKKRVDTRERLYNVYRPNTGLLPRPEVLAEVRKRYRRLPPDQAEAVWKDQYSASATKCHHAYFHGRCRNEAVGITCEVGKRTRTYYVLSGSVLSVWPVVESVLQGLPGKRQNRMQVIRVRTVSNQKIVGILIPNLCVKALIDKLEGHTGRSYIETPKMTKKSSWN